MHESNLFKSLAVSLKAIKLYSKEPMVWDGLRLENWEESPDNRYILTKKKPKEKKS
jgi:hypothetical protein